MDDLSRRKELLYLNKQDQQENFSRGKHFQGLYKQKLVEKMWEKQARADSVKQRNHIIANSGIRVSQEQQSLMAAAQNAVKKWNTNF